MTYYEASKMQSIYEAPLDVVPVLKHHAHLQANGGDVRATAGMSAAWKDQTYGTGQSLNLGSGLRLSVSWETSHRLPAGAPKFNVSVFGRRLKQRSESLEDGKARAVRMAFVLLEEAKKNLSAAADDNL